MVIKLNENDIINMVSHALQETCNKASIDEINLKAALAGGMLALSPMAAYAGDDVKNQTEYVQPKQEESKPCVNMFSVYAVGETKEEAVSNAKKKIGEWCKKNGENNATIITMGDFAPHITSAYKNTSNVNGETRDSGWCITYEAMIMLSKAYGNKLIEL